MTEDHRKLPRNAHVTVDSTDREALARVNAAYESVEDDILDMAAEDHVVQLSTHEVRATDEHHGPLEHTRDELNAMPPGRVLTPLKYEKNNHYIRLIRAHIRISKVLVRAATWAAKGRMDKVAEILAVVLLSDDTVSKHTEARRAIQYRHLFRKKPPRDIKGGDHGRNRKKP